MKSGIAVDYMGDGAFMEAFHPLMQVTNLYGELPLPTIDLDKNVVEYVYPFTLPESIANPFLSVAGLHAAVDYYFTAVNASLGQWRLHLVGRVMTQKYGQLPANVVEQYRNPVTNGVYGNSFIVYGGFRG